MKRKSILKISAIILVVCFSLGGVAIGAMIWEIQRSVSKCSNTAQQFHPAEGDDVASLIAFIKSDKHDLKAKNRAVWALGQIADPRALDILKKHYTGEKCRHDSMLCQHELEKAIKRCTR